MPNLFGTKQRLSQRVLSTEHQDSISLEKCTAFQYRSEKLAVTQGALGNSSCPKLLAP